MVYSFKLGYWVYQACLWAKLIYQQVIFLKEILIVYLFLKPCPFETKLLDWKSTERLLGHFSTLGENVEVVFFKVATHCGTALPTVRGSGWRVKVQSSGLMRCNIKKKPTLAAQAKCFISILMNRFSLNTLIFIWSFSKKCSIHLTHALLIILNPIWHFFVVFFFTLVSAHVVLWAVETSQIFDSLSWHR